jgi:Carboxypeptidase regulatory-like domain
MTCPLLALILLVLQPASARKGVEHAILEGKVENERGAAVEGAVVVVTTGLAPEPQRATTDAKGRFRLELDVRGPVALEAYAPGYGPVRARGVDPGKPLSVVLKRGAAVSGVVRDGTTKAPIEGALVATRVVRASEGGDADPRRGVVEALTDERGSFRLEGLGVGSYRVSGSAPGYGRAIATASPGDAVELFLFPGSGIYGRVTDPSGKPVAGAYVAVEPRARPFSGDAVIVPEVTDADGRFAFLGLEPGAYAIAIRPRDVAPATRTVNLVKDDDTVIEIRLSAGVALTGHRIVGKLVAPRGAAVGGLRVFAVEDGADLIAPPSKLSLGTSVADGSFVLDQLGKGRYNVLAGDGSAGYAFAPAVGAGEEALELVLRPAGRLEVTVRNEEGEIVDPSAFGVVAVNGHKVRGVVSPTGGKGRPIEVSVPTGNLLVKAVAPPDLEATASVSVSEGATATVEIVLSKRTNP